MEEQVALALAPALGDAVAGELQGRFRVEGAQPGERLFVEGEPSDRLLIVLEGELVVSVGAGERSLELATRGSGTWLGEVGLFDGGPATATVTVSTPTRYILIDQASLALAQDEAPMACAALLRRLSRVMAERIAEGSAGIIAEVGQGHMGLTRAAPSRSWLARMMDSLLGASS